jgi:hypothetical protein
MPWRSKADVARHNKAAAKSPKKRKQWKAIANKLLAEGKSESQAIREASGVVGRSKRMYGGKK